MDNGSASGHAVIKGVPGIKATLEAAKASGLDDDPAALILTKLGIDECEAGMKVSCACCVDVGARGWRRGEVAGQ